MPQRLTRQDWLTVGASRLKTDGAAALTIDALCRAVARSKGSFYHHFKDAADFAAALGQDWLQRQTLDVAAVLPADMSASQALETLDILAAGLDVDLERAMRRWAAADPAIGDVVMLADKRRLEVLTALYERANVPSAEAHRLAVLDYAAFVGFLELLGVANMTGEEAAQTASRNRRAVLAMY